MTCQMMSYKFIRLQYLFYYDVLNISIYAHVFSGLDMAGIPSQTVNWISLEQISGVLLLMN